MTDDQKTLNLNEETLRALDDHEEFNDYTKEQMVKIAAELNDMQMRYDTRLLAALMAGRAGMLHGIMINGKVMTKEEAKMVWNQAGQMIENPPDRETKIVKRFNNELLEPKDIN